jgi:hypothetical protein
MADADGERPTVDRPRILPSLGGGLPVLPRGGSSCVWRARWRSVLVVVGERDGFPLLAHCCR